MKRFHLTGRLIYTCVHVGVQMYNMYVCIRVRSVHISYVSAPTQFPPKVLSLDSLPPHVNQSYVKSKRICLL